MMWVRQMDSFWRELAVLLNEVQRYHSGQTIIADVQSELYTCNNSHHEVLQMYFSTNVLFHFVATSQHNKALVHKPRSIRKWFSQFGVEDLDWSAQRPDFNHAKQIWD